MKDKLDLIIEALEMAEVSDENKQPEALRLAKWCELGVDPYDKAAAAELRRLHKVNEDLLETLEIILDSRPFVGMNPKAIVGSPNAVEWNVHTIARAAIAKATGKSNG